MVGLYETALDELCSREVEGHKIRPKIVASTATVRRAENQIRALFNRPAGGHLPAARPGSAGFVLRRDPYAPAEQRPVVRGHRRPGPQPEGRHVAGLPGAPGRGTEGVQQARRQEDRRQPGRSLHDRAGLFQQPSRAGRRPPRRRRRSGQPRGRLRQPQARGRSGRPVREPQDRLRAGRTDLAG